MRMLAPTVVLSYEHAGSPPLAVAGRCAHLFVVQNGKVESVDWVVFYPGKPAAASAGAATAGAPAASLPADPDGIRRGPRPV